MTAAVKFKDLQISKIRNTNTNRIFPISFKVMYIYFRFRGKWIRLLVWGGPGIVLGKLWFSCEVAHSGETLISVFQEFSSSIGKAFILAGGLGTGLSFYGV